VKNEVVVVVVIELEMYKFLCKPSAVPKGESNVTEIVVP